MKKIDWHKFSEGFWQRIRIYAAFLAVLALGVGLYGLSLAKTMTSSAPVLAPAVHAPQPTAEPEPDPAEDEPAASGQPRSFSAADITPVRVALVPDENESAPPEAAEPAPEDAAPAEATPQPQPEPEPAPVEPPAEEEVQPQPPAEPVWVYSDPTECVQGQAPCQGQISRGYGFTLDARYEDYRFHSGLDYTIIDNRSVYAVLAGTVAAIDQDSQTITIEQDGLRTIYRPVTDLTVSPGHTVSRGRALGNVPQDADKLHFALQKQQ